MTNATNSIAVAIAAINSRTQAARRIAQAYTRIDKAVEAVEFDRALVEAIKAHAETLPVEAGSFTANPGDTVTFKTGRADTAREEQGVVQLVDGAKYKLLVGEGFSQEFKTIFAGQITAVTAAVSEEATGDDYGLNA